MNKATTYTDSTLLTPCATATQVVLDGTTSCVAATDSLGNWGVWVPAGVQYAYTFTSTAGNFGPYYITSPVMGAPGGGVQATQVAFGSALNTIVGGGNFIWSEVNKQLSVQGQGTVLRTISNGSALNSVWADEFSGPQANGTIVPYAYIQAQIISNTNSLATGQLDFFVDNAGTPADVLTLTSTGVTSPKVNGYIFVDGTAYAKTAAGINAALLACTAAGGSTVMLPPGTINLTAVLTWTGNACDLVGAGRNNTILHMVDATNNINAIVPSAMSRIAHLTLTGTGVAGNANGITGALSAVTVEDCDISGFGSYGINSGIGSSNWNISRNYIHNNLQAGILYSQSTNGIIQGNQIYSNTKNGIDIGGTSFTTIEGNSIYSNGGSGIPAIDQDGINDYSATAIGVSSHNAIIGNDIHDNNTHGIRLQAGAGGQILYDLVVGNNIHNNGNGNGVTKGGAGIIIRNDGGSGQMVGNTITGNTTSGAIGLGAGSCNGDGICLLSSGGAGAFNSNTISGNTSSGNGNYGLELINSTIVDTVVSGNTLVNNTTNPYTDTSARSAWGCNHTQVTAGGCEVNGSLVINGATSGSITHAVPAVAGANTITDPAATGTSALINVAQSWSGNQTGMSLVTPTIGGGTTINLYKTVTDTPGAITVNNLTCTDRAVALAGSGTGAVIGIAANYALDANIYLSPAQAVAGTVHYRICNSSGGNITLNAAAAFNLMVLQ